jgi:hypothetical protein
LIRREDSGVSPVSTQAAGIKACTHESSTIP